MESDPNDQLQKYSLPKQRCFLAQADGTNPCGYGALCWDPSGSPSTMYCVADCTRDYTDGLCTTYTAPCGNRCSANCGSFVTQLLGQNFAANKQSTSIQCKDLFGSECCSCIGKLPTDYVSGDEWLDLIYNKKKCKTCSKECFVTCPTDDAIPVVNTSSSLTSTVSSFGSNLLNSFIPRGGVNGGAGGGGGGGGGVCDCNTSNTCSLLGVSPCDTNCGYNAIGYHPLAIVMQQNNYLGDSITNGILLRVNCVSVVGTIIVMQDLVERLQHIFQILILGFIIPPKALRFFYTQNYINMATPPHLLKPTGSPGTIGQTARLLTQCNTCAVNPDYSSAGDETLCACHAITESAAWGNLLCPGAVTADYTYRLSNECGGGSTPCCNVSDLWCKVTRGGRIVLPPITAGDVNDANYAY
jgi:hypothetical protein